MGPDLHPVLLAQHSHMMQLVPRDDIRRRASAHAIAVRDPLPFPGFFVQSAKHQYGAVSHCFQFFQQTAPWPSVELRGGNVIVLLEAGQIGLVISRNAVFTHKGKAIKARQVAREFGVDYVVEGSVRKVADRVRVTIQLIDGETETHIWAERYDRKLDDIFAIQDEITSAIVATLFGRVEAARHDRVQRKRTANMAAYECVLTGKVLHHWSTREANAEAMRMLNRAIELDPNYAHARAWRACVIGQAWMNNWCEDRDASMRAILDEVQTVLTLDENEADVHRILGALKLNFDEYDKATYHQERALSLNPNSDIVVVQQGELLTWLGRPVEGIEWIHRAMRLNPYHPQRYWSHLGRAQYTARLYADAIQSFSKLTAPDYTHHAFLAASLAQLGNSTAAAAHAREVLQREPAFTAEGFLGNLHYQQHSDAEHLRDGLVKAGLPN